MSDQDTEQDETQDQADDERATEQRTDVTNSGVEVEGYESTNNPPDQAKQIMQAGSPDDIEDSLLEDIEEDRKQRLDPDNRPDNAEVDNTKRTFNPETATFDDSPEEAHSDDIGEGPSDEAADDADDEGDENHGDDSDGDEADDSSEQAGAGKHRA